MCYTYFIKNKDILEKWVKYLIEFGLDPENQLCTDDFVGIAAYAKLLESSLTGRCGL